MAEEWFIAKNGAPIGPLTEEELLSLASRGDVEGECLVWRQGMGGWVPFDEQFPIDAPYTGPSASAPAPSPAPPEAAEPETSAPLFTPAPASSPAPVVARAPQEQEAGPRPGPINLAQSGSLPAAMRTAKIMVNKPQAQSGGGGIAGAGAAQSEVQPAAIPSWQGKPRSETTLVKNLGAVTGVKNRAISGAPQLDKDDVEEENLRPWAHSPQPQPNVSADQMEEVRHRLAAPTPLGERNTQGMPEIDDEPITRRPIEPEAAPVVEAKSREPNNHLFSLRHFPNIDKLNPGLLRGGMFSMPGLGTGDTLKLAESYGTGPQETCDECGKSYQASHVNQIGGLRLCKLCQEKVKERIRKEVSRKEGFSWLGGPVERALYGAAILGLIVGAAMLIAKLTGFNLVPEVVPPSTEIGYDEILPPTAWSALPEEEWPQLVLSNEAVFSDTTPLNRGASFIVETKGRDIIGVTSMQLLTADYGVYPPVSPVSINSTLVSWKMHLPTNKELAARMRAVYKKPLVYAGTPVLFLKGETNLENIPATPLKIQRGIRAINDEVMIIVPAPNLTEGASQIVLRGNIRPNTSKNGQSVEVSLTEPVSPGMPLTGAPVLTKGGHVIGVCVGLSPFNDLWTVPDEEGQVIPVDVSQFREGYLPPSLVDSEIVYVADIRSFPEPNK